MTICTEPAAHSNVSSTRILLVEDVELEAKLVERALADRGFTDIVHVTDAESAVSAVDPERPCVIVTDIELPKGSGIDLVRKVRARGGPYVYIMLLTGRSNPARLREAFDAGADDYMCKPFQRDELTARVKVGERIVRLERDAQARARELEAALRKLDENAATQAIARARQSENVANDVAAMVLDATPWDDLRTALRESLVSFVGCDVASTTLSDPTAGIVGEASLVESARKVELGLAVVASGASTRALCETVLGEPGDAESGCALVLETANILMGSLKGLLASRGYDFTASLPKNPSLAETRATHDHHTVRQRFAYAAGNITLDVWLFVAEKHSSRVKAEDLREGMVLAEDAHDGHGMLLVRAGVRLTETGARRLGSMLGRGEVVIAA